MSHARFAGLIAAAILVASVVLACTDSNTSNRAASSVASISATPTSRACPVTRPSDRTSPPPQQLSIDAGGDETANAFGAGYLWVLLPGSPYSTDPAPDGTHHLKVGWWRGITGSLDIRADRLDGAGTARADIPSGYPPTGVQPTGIDFSDVGCWRVIGTLGSDTLSFVVLAI